MTDKIEIEIHFTEHNYTFDAFIQYFGEFLLENCTFSVDKDKDCPDIRIKINGIVKHVFEIKHKNDARQSRDSKHLYNCFNQLIRDYGSEVKHWFILVEHNESKHQFWDYQAKRYKKRKDLDKTIVSQMMYEGFCRGFCTRYVSYERFVELIVNIIKGVDSENDEIDSGIHYLEKKAPYKPKNVKHRKRCSPFETGLPAIKFVTTERAYKIAKKYSNPYQLVVSGCKVVDKEGNELEDVMIVPDPSRLELDEIFPLNVKGGKTKKWAVFITQIYGSCPSIKPPKKKRKSKKKTSKKK